MMANRSPLEAASALNLDVVLSGRLHPQDAGIQIQLELLETATGALLWGQERKLTFAEIPAKEKEITEAVKAAIFPRQPKRMLPDVSIPGHGAYREYLKGMHLLSQRSVTGIKAALEHFERAVDTDAGFALAYSGLADCYALLSISPYCAVRPGEAMPRAKAAAIRALELDPELAEAYASLGLVKLFYEWDRLSAELLFRRALELNPSYSAANLWFSLLLASMGRFDEALSRARYAQEIDPLSPAVHTLIAGIHYFKRDPENAIHALSGPIAQLSHHPLTWCFLGMGYIGVKRFERAVECFEKAGGFQSEITPVLAGMGYALSQAGRTEEVQHIIGFLEQQSLSRYIAPQVYVFLHLGLGEYEKALSWLQRAAEERCDFLIYLDVDAAFDPLRDHPRFKALQRSIREMTGSQLDHVRS
jgi:tetratricopeptide (TPR) repeat protein